MNLTHATRVMSHDLEFDDCYVHVSGFHAGSLLARTLDVKDHAEADHPICQVFTPCKGLKPSGCGDTSFHAQSSRVRVRLSGGPNFHTFCNGASRHCRVDLVVICPVPPSPLQQLSSPSSTSYSSFVAAEYKVARA